MSKFCKNCGESLNDDAAFCGKCGTRVEEQKEQPAAQPAEQEAAGKDFGHSADREAFGTGPVVHTGGYLCKPHL